VSACAEIGLRLAIGIATAAILTSQIAAAEPSPAHHRIGVLAAPYASAPANEGLRTGLRELGYVERQSILLEAHSGDTQAQLHAAAADLLRSKVELIAVFSTPAARAAAATHLPIVFLVGDPVSTGLAQSLAHPGGNATGIALSYAELITGRLEILRLLAPNAQRIGCLMNSSNPASLLQFQTAEQVAPAIGLQITKLDARNDAEIDAVIQTLAQSAIDGVLVTGDLLLFANKGRLAGALRENRLPAVFPSKEWHGDDELISYAPGIREAGRRMAVYVDKILKGATPGELPIEKLSSYELVIDLRAARSMRLEVPQALLDRANEVLQ
jgi:putative tryptophan/tyrosine transport system substrate-binding protein